MKTFIQPVFFVTLVFCLAGCEQRSEVIQPSGKTIKVGVIGSFSGPKKAWENKGLQGIEVAQKMLPYLNNGDKIELIVEDDRDNPTQTIEVLKKLVKEDQVSAILMLSDSDPVLAVSRLAERYFKTPILAIIASHPRITDRNTLINQLVLDNTFQAAVAALFVRDELLIDKVAVFSNPDSANSTHLAAEFIRKFESVNGEITDRIFLSEKMDHYAEILTQVRSKNPELLYLPVNAANLIALVKETKKMEWSPKIMASDGLLANVVAKHKDELKLIEGILATDFFGFDLPATPFGSQALETYTSLFGDNPTTHTALGSEGYALLVNAMNRCKNPDNKACINKMIRSTDSFLGLQSKISIGPDGKAKRPLIINTIAGEELEYVVIVY